MMADLSCHGALAKVKGDTEITLALAGNPNVGKSTVFNRLTGMGVVTANYPGKTVELNIATTTLGEHVIGVVDLPGVYALGAVSEDQWVARRGLLEGRPDVVVVVLDATNLARNLYLALQVVELGFPVVVALNLVDQAERQGLVSDPGLLSQHLGVPVIGVVATRGDGLDELVRVARRVALDRGPAPSPPAFGQDIEEHVAGLTGAIRSAGLDLPFGVSARSLALLLLEKDAEFEEMVGRRGGEALLAEAQRIAAEIEHAHGEPAPRRIARERHGLAGSIADEVQTGSQADPTPTERLWRLTTSPRSGVLVGLLVLAGVFASLFYVGGWLASAFSAVWAATLGPLVTGAIGAAFGDGVVANVLRWGFSDGIQAALAVGIPYVLTFYLLLGVLEDTGYLNSVAFLADRVMHRIGLHGRAMIPIVAGAGCNVPAIIGTRVLTTTRERVIAATLITLVPCSARTAVIMGAVSATAGAWPAIWVFLIDAAVIVVVGLILDRLMPGESAGLVMEMFPFRMPSARTVLKKTWFRFKDFVFVATPIVIGGSLALGLLYETGAIWALAAPMSPIVEGWLGLPPAAGLTLVFAVLRKELALQLLTTMASAGSSADLTGLTPAQALLTFMTPAQLFVYALVNTIYVPCVATIAVLRSELGWKRAAAVMAGTVGIAVLVGGIAHLVLATTGWLA